MSVYSDEDLKKLQEIELGMMKVVDQFCRENDIPYFLEGGTAIGAVRHAGFIPWDDDIDIGIIGSDYDRFIELFEANPPDGYSIHTRTNTENYPYMFAKVYCDGTRFLAQESIDAGLDSCIYLDVFRHDFVSPTLSEPAVNKGIARAMFWQRVLYLYYTPNPAIQPTASFRSAKALVSKFAHKAVRILFKPDSIAKRYEVQLQRLANGGSEKESQLTAGGQDGVAIPARFLWPCDSVLEFEGESFSGPHDVDGYLACLYGDYMCLPPKEKRKTHAPVVLDFGERQPRS